MGIYFVTDCFSGNAYKVDFGSFEVNPSEVWSFSGVGGTLYCGTINEGEQPIVAEYTGITQYTDCFTCQNPPTSAGTEVFLCEQICTESGTTVVSVVAPHPVWTNGYGGEVTQLNMITIGGNGLNS